MPTISQVLNINNSRTDSAKSTNLLTIKKLIRENIFACLLSVHNAISLSRHEQDVINLLYH